MMMESSCVSPEKFIDRSSYSEDDVDDNQDATPTSRQGREKNAIISCVERNSKKLLLLAAAFALIGAIGLTSQSKQLADKAFSFGKKAPSKGLRGSSKSSKSSKTSSSRSRKSDTQKDLGSGNSAETTLFDAAEPDTTQDLIQAGMTDEFVEGSFLEEEMVDMPDISTEEAAATVDGLLNEPSEVAEEETALLSEATDEETDADAETTSSSQAPDGNSDADVVSATTEEDDQESAHDADKNGDDSGTSTSASNLSEGDNTSSGAPKPKKSSRKSRKSDSKKDLVSEAADAETTSVTEESDSNPEVYAETASVPEAADANTGSQASTSKTDKTDAETTSLSQASDGNSDAETVSATTEEEVQESAHDADDASIESPDTGENSVDWNSFSNELQDMTSSESSVNGDDSGTSTSTSNLDGGENTSSGASGSSSNFNEDDGSSSNGSNGTSDNTSSSASNTAGGDNTSSAYGDDNGSSYANYVASGTESASTNEAAEEGGEDPTAEENVANLATKNIGSDPARSGFLSMLAVSTVAFFAVGLYTNLKNKKKEANRHQRSHHQKTGSDASSETESASTNEATEEVGEDPTAEENVATSDNHVNLATKNIGSNPARSGFLSMLAVSIVAFFAVVLSTILKNNKKEAAAAGGGDGGNSDPLDDDSSIWSANEDIGDMAGPCVSG